MDERPSSAHHRPVKVVSSGDLAATSSALDVPASPSSAIPRDFSSLDIASRRRFKSYRLHGEFEKPWLADPAMNKTKWNNWIVRGFILLGLVLAGVVACVFLVWPYKDGPTTSPPSTRTSGRTRCSSTASAQAASTGPPPDAKNSYVDAEGLHIVPTLTNESTPITNNDPLRQLHPGPLTKDGSCTSTTNTSCITTSDPKKGAPWIPPIRSAPPLTKGKKSIRDDARSLHLRRMASQRRDRHHGIKSNSRAYTEGGRNYYYGTLHWATGAPPTQRCSAAATSRAGFHTFGVQWTPQLHLLLHRQPRTPNHVHGFDRAPARSTDLGLFASMAENQTLLANPWAMSNSTTGNAPFDQSFYLILQRGCRLQERLVPPWIDGAKNAQWTLLGCCCCQVAADPGARAPTSGMTVKSVKMWQAGQCGSSSEL
ncbi:hypothetical protein J3459_013726 [Metarhizium acridum]|nr:hypothetical protein J3459_013726 [Metarhizium acridum]